MDYSQGRILRKYQWDICHSWSLGINWFEGESEGESVVKETILGYIISDAKAYIRENNAPYSIKVPNEILTKGKEIEIVDHLVKDKTVTLKYLGEATEYITSYSNITKIQELKSKEKYLVLNDQESSELPYSDTKTGNKHLKNTNVIADKICGEYYQIKEKTTSNKGWWVDKASLKRVDNDLSNNFDWMNTVTLGTGAIDKETIKKIEENLKGINDRTNPDIYKSTLHIASKGDGFVYNGVDKGSPQVTGTEFEKKLKGVILSELQREGSYSSINTWDGEHFTWGKGFSVRGILMDVIDNLLKVNSRNYEQIFSNVGIKVVNKHFWVLDAGGNWKKDTPPQYDASDYLEKNTQLLSFFIELGEKPEYFQDVINAQAKAIDGGAAKYPSYILNADKTGYADNWNDESVSVLCHLSHWSSASYTWNEGTERYKDTKGDLDKILYKYLYKSASGSIALRKSAILEINIYEWNLTFNVLNKLHEFGQPLSIGQTKLNEKWNIHTIELEFKKDKSGKLRALQMGTKKYISNSDCVIFKQGDKYLIVTNDANAITYEDFEE